MDLKEVCEALNILLVYVNPETIQAKCSNGMDFNEWKTFVMETYEVRGMPMLANRCLIDSLPSPSAPLEPLHREPLLERGQPRVPHRRGGGQGP